MSAETPWYPDDSGEWIEHDGSSICPVDPPVECETLSGAERINRTYIKRKEGAENWDWRRVVAYKLAAPAKKPEPASKPYRETITRTVVLSHDDAREVLARALGMPSDAALKIMPPNLDGGYAFILSCTTDAPDA